MMIWKVKLVLVFVALPFLVNLFGQDEIIQISPDLELRKLTEHAYLYTSYYDLEKAPHFPANGMVYLDGDKAYVVDTPWRDRETQELIDWVRNNFKVTIQGFIVTHWHQDCMGGLATVHKNGIHSYALDKTREIANAKNLPLPKTTFSDSLVLYLNDKALICKYPGAGHTVDNIIVWLPDEKILFGGCLVKALAWNGLGNINDAVLEDWPITLEDVLLNYPESKIVIPGHGAVGDLSLIRHTISLFKPN
jgi:metallo-beta-lactamase class B